MWNDYALARGLHVLAVLMWIGGVGLVTTVLIPAIRREAPVGQAYARFQAIEHRFAAQARGWVLLAGVSGAWMLHTTAGWVTAAASTIAGCDRSTDSTSFDEIFSPPRIMISFLRSVISR